MKRFTLLSILILVTIACGGGGGGGSSPTTPPPPPITNVSGNWSGQWVTANTGLFIPVEMNLSQNGVTVSGGLRLQILYTIFTFEVDGHVQGNRFNWAVDAPGCGTLDSPTGFVCSTGPNPTSMTGRILLDGSMCGSKRYGGDATLTKTGGSATGASTANQTTRINTKTLVDLIEAMAKQ